MVQIEARLCSRHKYHHIHTWIHTHTSARSAYTLYNMYVYIRIASYSICNVLFRLAKWENEPKTARVNRLINFDKMFVNCWCACIQMSLSLSLSHTRHVAVFLHPRFFLYLIDISFASNVQVVCSISIHFSGAHGNVMLMLMHAIHFRCYTHSFVRVSVSARMCMNDDESYSRTVCERVCVCV